MKKYLQTAVAALFALSILSSCTQKLGYFDPRIGKTVLLPRKAAKRFTCLDSLGNLIVVTPRKTTVYRDDSTIVYKPGPAPFLLAK